MYPSKEEKMTWEWVMHVQRRNLIIFSALLSLHIFQSFGGSSLLLRSNCTYNKVQNLSLEQKWKQNANNSIYMDTAHAHSKPKDCKKRKCQVFISCLVSTSKANVFGFILTGLQIQIWSLWYFNYKMLVSELVSVSLPKITILI